MFAEPIGRIISSHTALLLEITTRKIGKIISLTIDCTKFKEAKLTMKATEIAMILYSLRNSMNLLKIAIILHLEDDIYKTFEFMKTLDPHYVHITIFTPFPGTKIYRSGIENGVIKNDYWREFSENPTNDFILPYWGEVLKREQLNALLIKGYKIYYMRPSYIFKNLCTLKSLEEFKKKAIAGLKLLAMR